jgi:hypothetical protein
VARDLIPPPSPAGRPSADATALEAGDEDTAADPSTPPSEAPAAARAPAEPAPFRARFGFVLGTLLGIAVCAAIGVVLLLGTGHGSGGGAQLAEHWSAWQPPSSEPAVGAAAIAAHVGRDYRLANGKQLVAVEGGALAVQGFPLQVRLSPADGTIRNYGSDGVLYTLHGSGTSGKIVGEKPSVSRHRLLRREALELALYSFRYLDGITEVVALLPPTDPKASAKATGKSDSAATSDEQPQLQALFYRPGDLKSQLESPLSHTLAAGRLNAKRLAPAEARRIDALTLPNLFLASLQLAQNQQAYMVLERPSRTSPSG